MTGRSKAFEDDQIAAVGAQLAGAGYEATIRADERAAIRRQCLDLASQEGQRAKQATKKGHVDDAVIARCRADAYRLIARKLAPKKARKVTK